MGDHYGFCTGAFRFCTGCAAGVVAFGGVALLVVTRAGALGGGGSVLFPAAAACW
jgi:hypothetical protein